MFKRATYPALLREIDQTRVAVILGVTGQDGSLLAGNLISRGWSVIGVARNIDSTVASAVYPHELFKVVRGTITDQAFLEELFLQVEPDAVFNVAGFTHVGSSWDAQAESREVNFFAVQKIVASLELMQSKMGKAPHYYHSSSSEIFGGAVEKPQREDATLNPVTPYGEHKALAHSFLQGARSSTELPITIGILYNHESPLRPKKFVSRKISAGVAAIALGLKDTLVLGNVHSSRDWGFAGDYVKAIEELVVTRTVGDFIIATGVEHTVKDFVSQAFECIGIDRWEQHLEISEGLFRDADPNMLVGNPSKIHRQIGWAPTTSFEDLVRMMVSYDLSRLGSADTENLPGTKRLRKS